MQISKSFKERIKNITIPMLPEAYSDGVPHTFIPWEANLSPSALYNCSVACRKAAGHKTPELKWVSVKRWVNITPAGVTLPNGCFLSVKRRETFEAMPRPKFIKQDYVLLLMPYGNLFYWNNEGDPLSEESLWKSDNANSLFDVLLERDLTMPLAGYFKLCYLYKENNPEQVGIHLKRKKLHPVPDEESDQDKKG